jgi:hypothetical protein
VLSMQLIAIASNSNARRIPLAVPRLGHLSIPQQLYVLVHTAQHGSCALLIKKEQISHAACSLSVHMQP